MTKVSEKIIDKFPKYLQQTKMAVWQRVNSIIRSIVYHRKD